MTDFEVPELDVFAIDFPAFLSRLAPSIYRDMPFASKAPRKLVRDGYNRVIAFRGCVVPRLAHDGDASSTRSHVIVSFAISIILLDHGLQTAIQYQATFANELFTYAKLTGSRRIFDLVAILKQTGDPAAQFHSLAEPWANTGTSAGRLMLALLGGLAGVERDLIRTRTAEGRSRARKRGQHGSTWADHGDDRPRPRPAGDERRRYGYRSRRQLPRERKQDFKNTV